MNAIIKVRDDAGAARFETAEMISMSAGSAGIKLCLPVTIGRLIALLLPLPNEMRLYDHDRELYRVWGIVQHCNELLTPERSYHVGVSFIGPKAPDSYFEDPDRSYMITGTGEDGFWLIKAADVPFRIRGEARYWRSVNSYVGSVGDGSSINFGGKGVTENISNSGAAVICDVPVKVGDKIKFISPELDFSAYAEVRGSHMGDDARNRIHIRFTSDKPLCNY